MDLSKEMIALSKACQPVLKQLQDMGKIIEAINQSPDFQLFVRMIRENSYLSGQHHLEVDETQLESTGKSVDIDDVIAQIDEALKTGN